MKKKIIILTAFMGLLLSACSDFLDRKPLTQPEDKGFLVGREQLENYINGLYSALPTPTQFGMSVRGEEVNSDNILAENSTKASFPYRCLCDTDRSARKIPRLRSG